MNQQVSNNVSIQQLPLPAPEYGHSTYPRFREFLTETDDEMDQANGQRLAVPATTNGEAVGLALLTRRYGEAQRRLLSICVDRKFRQRGIATELVEAVEKIKTSVRNSKLGRRRF